MTPHLTRPPARDAQGFSKRAPASARSPAAPFASERSGVAAAIAPPRIKRWTRRAYLPTLYAMQTFTLDRGSGTRDEIWLVEHPPVFTLGHASRPEHLRRAGDIPVVRTERGGQVTYHGPGQVVAYLLIDLRRRGLGVRDFVSRIEAATIELLGAYAMRAMRRSGAPGVFFEDGRGEAGAKVASIGIRVSRGCSYHGAALNVAMDLEPFTRIDPCGYPGLAVADMRSRDPALDIGEVASRFGQLLARHIEKRP